MRWGDRFEYSDGHLLWKPLDESHRDSKRWNGRYAGKIAGSIHSPKKSKTQYVRVVIRPSWYLAHNVIWEMFFGDIPEGMEVDHINGDGTDNRVENLRLVSQSENHKNRPKYSNNSSGESGVSWDGKSRCWIGRVSIEGSRKVVYRGDSKEDAAKIVREKRASNGYHANHGR